MDLEPKTQARIVKLFEHQICSSCGNQAERYVEGKTFCQRGFLVNRIRDQDVFVPKVFHDPKVL